MGFGFNLFVVFILVPLTVILIIVILFTRNKFSIVLLLMLWAAVFGIIALSFIAQFLTSPKVLKTDDIYGNYVINRNYFKGKQADWQYNHFRLTLTRQNRFMFYVTDRNKIRKTYTGSISFINDYLSPRIVFHPDTPSHHIIDPQPTLYRAPFSFYYVFHSPLFGNVFFRKGEWKPIEE